MTIQNGTLEVLRDCQLKIPRSTRTPTREVIKLEIQKFLRQQRDIKTGVGRPELSHVRYVPYATGISQCRLYQSHIRNFHCLG